VRWCDQCNAKLAEGGYFAGVKQVRWCDQRDDGDAHMARASPTYEPPTVCVRLGPAPQQETNSAIVCADAAYVYLVSSAAVTLVWDKVLIRHLKPTAPA
jgi:hypothetical protein